MTGKHLKRISLSKEGAIFPASYLLIAALRMVDNELCMTMQNVKQASYDSPFGNTGNSFKLTGIPFEVQSYSWHEAEEGRWQDNFKWRDVRVSWYKYLGRSTEVNQQLSPARIDEMLNDCLGALSLYEKKINRELVGENYIHEDENR